MKLHADSATSLNTVTAYGPGYVEINRQKHQGPILLMPEGSVLQWRITAFEQLDETAFAELLAFQPEVVLLGTGSSQRFPHPRLAGPIAAARIGLDVMSTAAACRTYNILMAESRRVLAALLPA